MAATFLAPPPKRTQSVQLSKVLLRFIGSHCNVNSADFKDAVSELNSLREATVVRTPDKHEAGLDLITRYYHQVASLTQRLPISERELNIKFTWYDAFSKEGFLSGGRKTTMVSGVFEQCCVLFNISSLQAHIARSQNYESDEGIKNACKHFQGAAGTFQQLRELVYSSSEIQAPPSPDLSAEATTALQSLMLAQAQEAFCRKALKDKMKDAITAKVAMQASDLYADAHNNMLVGQVKGMWDKGWLSIAVAKRHYFHGMAQYKMGCVARDDKLFGLALARMQLAMSELQDCDRHGEASFSSSDLLPLVQRDHQAIRKDNDFIYHDRVPAASTLDAISKATIAKPIRLAPPAANFVDLFAALLPVEVSRALVTYTEKSGQLVTMEITKLKEATQVLNGVLASLNLPACIEDMGGNDSLPQSLLDKGNTLRNMGGVAALQQQITELPDLLQTNRDIINEVMRSLDEEERDDTSLRERFKEKWSRTPSAELTKEIRANLAKYQGHIQAAEQADVTVRQKYEEYRPTMELLCQQPAELARQIPKPTKTAAIVTGSKVVADLKDLLGQVDTIKAEREAIMVSLREPGDDIVTKFLTALKEEGVVDEPTLSDAHLSLIYESLQGQVSESVSGQQDLVARMQAAHEVFVQECGVDSSGRDQLLQQLAATFDVYNDLGENLFEGTKFYTNLTTLLVKQQSKVNDLLFARNVEKDGAMKDLQSSLARAATEQPDNVPAHHQSPVPVPRIQRQQPPVQVAPPPAQVAPPPEQPPAQRGPPPQGALPPAQYQPPPQRGPPMRPPPPQGALPPAQYQPPPQTAPQYRPPLQTAPPPASWQHPPPAAPYMQPMGSYPSAPPPMPYYPQYYQAPYMAPPQGYPAYTPPYGAPPPQYQQPRPPHQ